MYGKIVVIKRTGADGAHFPLIATSCMFGRSCDCDIRIQLPYVSREHCSVDINSDEQAFVSNLSETYPIKVNNIEVTGSQLLQHGDVITIVDRAFRFEFAPASRHFPNKISKVKSPRTPKSKSPAKTSKILSPKTKPPSLDSSKGSPKKPLSPRSDNIVTPVSSVSPKGLKTENGKRKSLTKNNQNRLPATDINPLDELLDGLSPASFYKKTTPAKVRSSSTISTTDSAILSELPKSGRKSASTKNAEGVSACSPYRIAVKELRKSISDLRRKSGLIPEENLSPSANLFRKRVSFGPHLSPEHFDKTLPPKTPVKKGATPRRSLPASVVTSYSLLKRQPSAWPIQEADSPITSRRSLPSAGNKSPAKESLPDSHKKNDLPQPFIVSSKMTPSPAARKSPKGKKSVRQSASLHILASVSPEANIYPKRGSPQRRRSLSPNYAQKSIDESLKAVSFVTDTNNSQSPRSGSASPTVKNTTVMSPAMKMAESPSPKSKHDSALIKNATPASSRKSVNRSPTSNLRNSNDCPVVADISSESLDMATPKFTEKATNTSSARTTPASRKKSPAKSTEVNRLLFSDKPSAKKRPSTPSPTPLNYLFDTPNASLKKASERFSSGRRISDPQISLQSPILARVFTSAQNTSVEQSILTDSLAERKSATASPVIQIKETEILLAAPEIPKRKASEEQIMKYSALHSDHITSPKLSASAGKRSETNSLEDSPVKSSANNKKTPGKSPTSARKEIHSIKQCGRKAITPSPIGLKRLGKNPKSKVTIASPSGIARLMKTPEELTVISSSSPDGICQLIKTPRTSRTRSLSPSTESGLDSIQITPVTKSASPDQLSQTSSPTSAKKVSSKKQHSMKKAATPSLIGLKRLVKTPKSKAAAASPSGIDRLMKTPEELAVISSVNPQDISQLIKMPNKSRTSTKKVSSKKQHGMMKATTPCLIGLRRLVKTPKSKAAAASPSGIARLMKTPEELTAISSSSPDGICQLIKTPRTSRTRSLSPSDKSGLDSIQIIPVTKSASPGQLSQTSSPTSAKKVSSQKQHGMKKAATPSLIGLKRLVKTPKSKAAAASPSGIDRLMKTPEELIVISSVSPQDISQLIKTPISLSPSTKSGLDSVQITPVTKSASPGQLSQTKSPTLAKIVASQKQHGMMKAVTPSQIGLKRLVKTPKSKAAAVSPSGIARLMKTPEELTAISSVSPQDISKLLKTPNKSRTLAKKVSSKKQHSMMKATTPSPIGLRRLVKTPKSKATAVSPSGIARLMKTPEELTAISSVSPQDISQLIKTPISLSPSTKSGLDSVRITPVTKSASPGQLSQTKSPTLAKIVASQKQHGMMKAVTPSQIGLKRLVKTPKSKAAAVSPSGIARLMKTPEELTAISSVSPQDISKLLKTPNKSRTLAKKVSSRKQHSMMKATTPSPIGLRRLVKTPKSKATAVSPSGIARLMKTPEELTAISSVSPQDISKLLKTPNKSRTLAKKVSSKKQHGMMKATTPSPIGLKRLVKTPKSKATAVSPSGIARLMKTPEELTANSSSTEGVPPLLTSSRSRSLSPSTESGLVRLRKTPRTSSSSGQFKQITYVSAKKVPSKQRQKMKTTTTPSPLGLKRLLKSPKFKAAAVSPSGIARLMKTPEELTTISTHIPKVISPLKKLETSLSRSVSPSTELGLDRLCKTPRTSAAFSDQISQTKFPTSAKRVSSEKHHRLMKADTPDLVQLKCLVKTQKTKEAAVSPLGIARLMKTPEELTVISSPCPRGVSRLLKTPESSTKLSLSHAGFARLSRTPRNTPQDSFAPVILATSKNSPKKAAHKSSAEKAPQWVEPFRSPFQGKARHQTDLSGVSALFHTPVSGAPTVKNLTKSKKKALTMIAQMLSPVGKLVAPPADLKKLVALRAIHGKTITPKLTDVHISQEIASEILQASISKARNLSPKVKTRVSQCPQSPKNTTKNTQGKLLWSDIVKEGIAITGAATKLRTRSSSKKVIKRVASKSTKKRIAKTPKTPKTVARVATATTGHADSPVTLVVGRNIFSKRRKTPQSKRKSRAKTVHQSFESQDTPTQQALYAELPDTPNGPGQMFVSPLSGSGGGHQLGRKSISLLGVRDMFHKKKSPRDARLSGVNRLVSTPRNKNTVSPNLTGLTRLFKTPKTKLMAPVSVSPSGIEFLFATTETESIKSSEPALEVLVSPELEAAISTKKTLRGRKKITSQVNTETTQQKCGRNKKPSLQKVPDVENVSDLRFSAKIPKKSKAGTQKTSASAIVGQDKNVLTVTETPAISNRSSRSRNTAITMKLKNQEQVSQKRRSIHKKANTSEKVMTKELPQNVELASPEPTSRRKRKAESNPLLKTKKPLSRKADPFPSEEFSDLTEVEDRSNATLNSSDIKAPKRTTRSKAKGSIKSAPQTIPSPKTKRGRKGKTAKPVSDSPTPREQTDILDKVFIVNSVKKTMATEEGKSSAALVSLDLPEGRVTGPSTRRTRNVSLLSKKSSQSILTELSTKVVRQNKSSTKKTFTSPIKPICRVSARGKKTVATVDGEDNGVPITETSLISPLRPRGRSVRSRKAASPNKPPGPGLERCSKQIVKSPLPLGRKARGRKGKEVQQQIYFASSPELKLGSASKTASPITRKLPAKKEIKSTRLNSAEPVSLEKQTDATSTRAVNLLPATKKAAAGGGGAVAVTSLDDKGIKRSTRHIAKSPTKPAPEVIPSPKAKRRLKEKIAKLTPETPRLREQRNTNSKVANVKATKSLDAGKKGKRSAISAVSLAAPEGSCAMQDKAAPVSKKKKIAKSAASPIKKTPVTRATHRRRR